MTTLPPVICERLFQQVVADGEAKTFRVAWMHPVAQENDWSCEYMIEWPDRPWRSRRIMGVDSAQALLLAMKSAAGELYDAEPRVSGGSRTIFSVCRSTAATRIWKLPAQRVGEGRTADTPPVPC